MNGVDGLGDICPRDGNYLAFSLRINVFSKLGTFGVLLKIINLLSRVYSNTFYP